MEIGPLRKDIEKYIQRHNLTKKWQKARRLFQENIRHPSLHVELLEPRWRGIYSFRLDRQYRALFFLKGGKAEIFQITNHYKK
jgi:plasmid maintenance system killer protein